MFKIGIYSKQQNAIVILLVLILCVQLRNSFAPSKPDYVVHPVGTLVSPATFTQDEIESGEYASEGEVSPTTKESGKRLYNLIKDYQLKLQDNGVKIVLYDNGKPVYVFDRREHPNCELFKRIDMDNE